MRHVVDARGTSVALPDRVGRVVSLVPSLTEWLVVAGVGERLVGVTAVSYTHLTLPTKRIV